MFTFKPSFILLTIVFFYLLFLIREDVAKYFLLKSEQERFIANIAAEESLNKQLKLEAKLLDSSGYIEGLAREKLGLIKSDETPYKVVRQ